LLAVPAELAVGGYLAGGLRRRHRVYDGNSLSGKYPWWPPGYLVVVEEAKYVSRVRIVRERGPVRKAYLPVESQPIMFGTHDEVREHYGTAPGQYPDHATTLDYVVAAAAG
jgi:hypothetical protein